MRLLFLPLAAGAVLAASVVACSSDPDDGSESTEEALASNVHVLTSKNDVGRTGANPKEKILKVANVNASTFGKIATRAVDGQIYAQPLYVGGVDGKNVVYVATEHNSVFAFDADNLASNAAPLWAKTFGPPVPAQDTGCALLTPEIGITSTPVIDLPSKTMWLTTRNKENGKYFHRLHAVDIATGAPKPGSPATITAQAPGTGTNSFGGVVRFDPLRNHQRPGLLKAGNRIYIGFASNCDIQDYHGWVLAYDATTLQQKSAHITTPNGGEGGIWHGGVGLASDESGDVFYAAGDVYPQSAAAPFNGANNLGNSIVRLKDTGSALQVRTSFTPFDTATWSPQDLSLGPTGVMLIPGTQVAIAGDKRGVMYVVNKNQMGAQANQDAQIVQKFQGTTRGMWGGGAYLKTGATGIYYLWGTGDRLKAYKFNGQKFDLPPRTNTSTLIGYPGGQLSVSSDGDVPGSAVLWAVRPKRTTPGLASSGGPGVLMAFNALDVTQTLYSSETIPGDALGAIAKFAPPTIANGRVYVGTAGNQLAIYGLRAGNPLPVTDAGAPPVDSGVALDAGSGPAPTWTQLYAQLIGPGTPGHCSGTGGCHTNIRGGFKCGTNKSDCYAGLVAAGLVTPGANGAQSPLGVPGQSPLAWFGGSMPLDNDAPNPAAAAAVKAWLNAGAQNN